MTRREALSRKQIHLGLRVPERSDDFDSLVQLARTAERGSFDFVFVAGDVADASTTLSALAAVTDRLGLVSAVDTHSDEPFEVARRLATLDHLSDGRAGWRVDHVDERAEEFITVVRAFWDSWEPDAVLADLSRGVYVDVDRIHPVEHRGAQFDVGGVATLPARPAGHPVLLAAGHFAAVLLDGTAAQVAAEIDGRVQAGECDGFVVDAAGLDQFVDAVVPLLQERGVFRTAYDGTTLREHLRP